MFFTICVPTYNRAHTILRTLESIRIQSFKSYEVLIIDDGSIDDTNNIVQNYIAQNSLSSSFHYYYKKNGGKHTALNYGITLSKGEFFIILDSDDWLVEDALNKMAKFCETIRNDDSYCGIMGRAVDIATHEIIGDLFDESDFESSYFDYHFVLPQKMYVSDSVEANKTTLLKQHVFPEGDSFKFVPEAYVFDQLGVKYKLRLTNDVYRFTEYLPDGMTKTSDFKERNYIGFLYQYVSRIEDVLPNAKCSKKLKVKLLVLSWWRYWQTKKLDKDKKGPSVKKITFIGFVSRIMSPLIGFTFKLRFKRG